jgi:hypothetical protein
MNSVHELLTLTSARNHNEADARFTFDEHFNFLLSLEPLHINNPVEFFVKSKVFTVEYIWVKPDNL